jgi:hypothetical protein
VDSRRIDSFALASLVITLAACPVDDDDADDDDVGDTGTGDTDSESTGESDESTEETTGESTEDGDGDTTTGDGDGECGEWSSLKTRAQGLDKVWTDGVDILSLGDGDLVKLVEGEWIDIEATTVDRMLYEGYDIWGPAHDDHWVLGAASSELPGLWHHDGTQLAGYVAFSGFDQGLHGHLIPIDLAGSAADDVWATAVFSCDTRWCSADPDCPCNAEPSRLMHYDGIAWSSVASPGLITRIWTNGTNTWGIGGRDETDVGWLTPIPGSLAGFDGVDWTVWADDLPPLDSLWSLDGSEVWVGGDDGTLRRFSGPWEIHDLPTSATVVKIEGRSSTEIWALDDAGELWAFDGSGWNSFLSLPHARDFAVMNDVLVVVGEDHGHRVDLVDIENESTDTVYWRRGDFRPGTIVVDDMQSAVTSWSRHTLPPEAQPSGSWRWDGVSWSPTYEQFPLGFDDLVGDVDQGFATRYRTETEFDPDFHPVYEIVDGEVFEIQPPAANLRVFTSERFTLAGQDQLWISTATLDFENPQYGLWARIGQAWVDRQPPGLSTPALSLTQGGERVFANFNSSITNITWMFEDGIWSDISNPLEGTRALSLAATGPDELWMTVSVGLAHPNQEQLYFWDGADWHVAKDLFPELAGHHHWWVLEARAPDDLWMISSRYFEPESVAHWDGRGWTVLDTPPLLHGWSIRQDMLLAPTQGGVFIHDGIRLWTYEECMP